jgi:signal recognition particle receptor subunit beta
MITWVHQLYTTVTDINKFAELGQQLFSLFKARKKIYIFGNSGSGKSQFVQAMQNSITIPNRNLTTERTKLDFKGFPMQLVDTPGHSESSQLRKSEIKNVIKGNVEGIIQFVNYGYDETPDADRNIAFDLQGNIKAEFLNYNREQEIHRLQEWSYQVDPQAIKWIIILINKADIWWEKRDIVKAYYNSDNYRKALAGLDASVPVITIPYCGIIRPFFKVKTSGFFGEEDKAKLHNDLINNLVNLIRQEK